MKHPHDAKSDVTGPGKAFTPEQKALQPQLLRRNLSDDIEGLPSQDLPQVSLPPMVGEAPESASAPDRAQDPVIQALQLHAQASDTTTQGIEASSQEPSSHADTWSVQMHVRIHRLKDNIHHLSDRLNQFEK